jgi:hypothetical protein
MKLQNLFESGSGVIDFTDLPTVKKYYGGTKNHLTSVMAGPPNTLSAQFIFNPEPAAPTVSWRESIHGINHEVSGLIGSIIASAFTPAMCKPQLLSSATHEMRDACTEIRTRLEALSRIGNKVGQYTILPDNEHTEADEERFEDSLDDFKSAVKVVAKELISRGFSSKAILGGKSIASLGKLVDDIHAIHTKSRVHAGSLLTHLQRAADDGGFEKILEYLQNHRKLPLSADESNSVTSAILNDDIFITNSHVQFIRNTLDSDMSIMRARSALKPLGINVSKFVPKYRSIFTSDIARIIDLLLPADTLRIKNQLEALSQGCVSAIESAIRSEHDIVVFSSGTKHGPSLFPILNKWYAAAAGGDGDLPCIGYIENNLKRGSQVISSVIKDAADKQKLTLNSLEKLIATNLSQLA